jgi:ribonuclease Z
LNKIRIAVLFLIAQTLAAQSFRDGGLHIVLCGTGSPLADPQRVSACTAIVAGSEFLLVDIGPGSWRKADLAQLPLSGLSGILLTHFHSDHIGDLGEAITMSWAAGRTETLKVYGPPGVEDVVDGFQKAYAADARYRNQHHGEDAMPSRGARAVAIPIPVTGQEAALVFDRNGLRVFAFPVRHEPVVPAYGYRVEYAGRKVVISGDTRKSSAVEKNAAGADLLIHEALNKEAILAGAGMAESMGQLRRAKMARDITTYHATPIEVAELAAAAHVDVLVFTHMIPPLLNAAQETAFLKGVAGVFKGKVILGKDGLRLDLPPKP